MRTSLWLPSPFVLTCATFLILATLPASAQVCVLNELQKLSPSDSSDSDRFGASVSISGKRAVVGAWGADHEGTTTGAAYVYRKDDNGTPFNASDDFWVEEDKLTALDAMAGDLFGWSVSISKNRAIVGARFHVVTSRSGAAYVFRLDDNDTLTDPTDDFWVQDARLTPMDAARSDDFGMSVSISGDLAIVGASNDDDACVDEPDPDCNSGSAYVFRHDDNGTPLDPGDDFWVEEDKLTASDAAPGDQFGFAVSISGNRVVVGAWHDDNAGTDSGSAYVFRRDDNATPLDPTDDFWVQEARLTASDAARFDNFGIAVSISGDRAVVGSWLDDDAGSLSGSAYVFRRDDHGTPLDLSDDVWVEEDKLTASDAAPGDEFGKSVSIDGDRIAVGAFEDDDACADDPNPDPNCDSGSAYAFRRDDNNTPSNLNDDFWVEVAKLTASDTAAGEFFGRVSISGDQIITGSLDDAAGSNGGAAYVFFASQGCTDLADFAEFQTCVGGDGQGVRSGCEAFNSDGDNDVDLMDYFRFQWAFVGP